MTTALSTVVVPLIPKWRCRLLDSWRNGRTVGGPGGLPGRFFSSLFDETKREAVCRDGTRRRFEKKTVTVKEYSKTIICNRTQL